MSGSPLCCTTAQGRNVLPWWDTVWFTYYTLHLNPIHHLLFSFTIYFSTQPLCFSVEDPSSDLHIGGSFLLTFRLKHFISLSRYVDHSGQFWGREVEGCHVCVVCILSRTFSKTDVIFDTNKCRGWKKTFDYKKSWWFAQLLRVGVTHCKVRRWKERFPLEEMVFWQGGWPNGSSANWYTPCLFLAIFNFHHLLGACCTF